MELTNQLVFLAGLLFVASILSTVITPRLGVPLLLVFLVVGMLAGEDGPGGIQFNNFQLANFAGTAALAVVLFDGGMRTPLANFRVGLSPAVSLASLGVLLTSLITGAFAAWVLDLELAQGLLIGAIVGSTDAAAVFSLLHTSAVRLNQRVTATLEIESATNDPMAVFLTLALIQYLLVPDSYSLGDALLLLLQQMGVGAVSGLIGGWLIVRSLNRLELNESLYPLLTLFSGILVFGATAQLGGSGFLAVFIAGLWVGNRRIRAASSVRRFHDGIAWLSQIGMFVLLGLLATPSRLLPLVLPGLLIALVLMLAARPAAVLISLLPFRFPAREKAYIAWVGLRGSVPILLATYPVMAGVEHAMLFFNTAFFIVLVSLLLQGMSLAPVARLLGLQLPQTSARVQRVELDLPGQRGFEVVSYRVLAGSGLVGLRHKELPLPDPSRVICLSRAGRVIPYREWNTLQEGDYVSLLTAEKDLGLLDQLFQQPGKPSEEKESETRYFGEFAVNPDAPAGSLAEAYGVELPPDSAGCTIAALFTRSMNHPVVGDRLHLDRLELTVRETQGDRITRIGLRLPH